MVYKGINIWQKHHAISVEEDGFTWIDFLLWVFFFSFLFPVRIEEFQQNGILSKKEIATEEKKIEKSCWVL